MTFNRISVSSVIGAINRIAITDTHTDRSWFKVNGISGRVLERSAQGLHLELSDSDQQARYVIGTYTSHPATTIWPNKSSGRMDLATWEASRGWHYTPPLSGNSTTGPQRTTMLRPFDPNIF